MQIDILGLVHAMILRCADLHVYSAILRKLVIEQWLTHHESRLTGKYAKEFVDLN